MQTTKGIYTDEPGHDARIRDIPTIVQAANMSHHLLTWKYCSSFSVESEVGGEPMACCVDGISLAEYVYSLVLAFKKQKQLMYRKAFL